MLDLKEDAAKVRAARGMAYNHQPPNNGQMLLMKNTTDRARWQCVSVCRSAYVLFTGVGDLAY